MSWFVRLNHIKPLLQIYCWVCKKNIAGYVIPKDSDLSSKSLQLLCTKLRDMKEGKKKCNKKRKKLCDPHLHQVTEPEP